MLNINFTRYKRFKDTLKKVLRTMDKIFNYKEINIEGWNRFANSEGIPLNSPPWGILAAIDIENKKKNWSYFSGLQTSKTKNSL